MNRHLLLIACGFVASMSAFSADSGRLEMVPSLPPLPPLVLISPEGSKAAKYAILDETKTMADPKAYLDPLRFVVWKGESEAEMAAFLKEREVHIVGWLAIFGAEGSKLPDLRTQKAVIAKFKELGIEVLPASCILGPTIYDPPAEGPAAPKK